MRQINLMALRHSAFYTPYLMTMAGGFLKQMGMQFSYRVESPGDSVAENISRGSCDVAQSAVAASFRYLQQQQKAPFMHFAQINARDGFFLAARTPLANFSWDMLKKQTVIVDHFFQPHAMLTYALHLKGLDFNDFTAIDAGDVSAMQQAFLNGEGNFIHLQGPAPQQMEAHQQAYVVASVGEIIGDVAFSSLCASPRWLETAMASDFKLAYTQAMQHTLQTPAENLSEELKTAGFFTEIDSPVLTDTISVYQQSGCWQTDTNISIDAFNTLLKVFMHAGLLIQPLDASSCITQIK